ncbi:MAG TPA: 3-hydroxyacyl-CoA dehydrogenase NAD-binding domain-containing protein [Puia sp.]|nr:3-hydroxyacyl-CoA dehydrogenase NAD-binding domain-containing protein [Puia sp.]
MIQTIGICGAGTMGSGIAQLAAMAGYTTILYDLDPTTVAKAKSAIEKNLSTLIEKKKITPADQHAIGQRLTFTTDINTCTADLIIEAIVEKPDIKLDLFRDLAAHNGPHAILASNTSSLSLNALAEKIPGPERFAGMHFFNPAPIMKLVEVVRTKYTSDDTIATITRLAGTLGKTPVLCADSPGFIVNHVARPYYLEALRLLESGLTDMDTIDSLMEATGFKMGPFRLMDLIGNDINYAVSESVYEALGSPERLKPSSIQRQKVQEGNLGRKTGKGYYRYE